MVARVVVPLLVAVAFGVSLPSQEALRGGDLRRIEWVRPYGPAVERATSETRLLLVKPILGGSNTPDPNGLPCGGKKDCDGSW